MNWLSTAQQELQAQGLEGWLLYDFRSNNPIFKTFVELPGFFTRRVFLFVPTGGQAVLLVHSIEAGNVLNTPFEVRKYSSRQSLETEVARLVADKKIALETSPMNDIPYVSHVDAGTVDMLRSLRAELVSSANLLQVFSAWTPTQLEQHLEAVKHTFIAKDLAFDFIRQRVAEKQEVRETHVQSVITNYFDTHSLVYDHAAIVGFGKNAGNPHYTPTTEHDSVLQVGDAILIDLWSKVNASTAPYADITWMGCYSTPSQELQTLWNIVCEARDLGLSTMKNIYATGQLPTGAEIDRTVRDSITARGYGDFFSHRTGHSIGNISAHGNAVHLDDFETHDTRELRPGIAVTIEPGIYLDHVGLRSEINVYIENSGPRATTEAQEELIVIPES
ncbi:MAG: M24 family metallopeptidase [Trueperaceae bacterium]